MTFPALDDFERDAAVTFARWRVYTFLRRGYLSFHEPRLVKAGALERQIRGEHGERMRRNAVIEALNWLVASGYVTEHGRDGRIRRLALAYSRPSYQNATMSHAA